MFEETTRTKTKMFTTENQRSYLVEGLICKNSLNFITGPSYVGKTTVLYSLAKCVADGDDWLNFNTDQGKVLIFDNEMGIYEFDRKMDSLDQNNLENVIYVEDQFIDVKNKVECLAFYTYIENKVKNEDLKLVIIDSLSACCGNLDENSNSDMRIFMEFADKLSHICTTFVIHHKGKSIESEFRGASIIKDRSDNFFVMDKSGEIKVSKNRSGYKNNAIFFDYIEDGELVSLCSKGYKNDRFEPKKDLSKAILENLEDNMNQTQLFQKMRSNGVRFVNDTASKLLKNMKNVEIQNGPNNSSIYKHKA
jgi:archaellum biogenesis ATPase FlaH